MNPKFLLSVLTSVGLCVSAHQAMAQQIQLQIQPQIPVQPFNPGASLQAGAQFSQGLFDAERRAREYNAQRRIYGNAAAYPAPPPPVAAPIPPRTYAPAPVARAPASGTILIFGGRGHKEYLGCLTCNEFEGSSVWNEVSIYGWHNSVGKWNDVSPYGSDVGMYSACNELSSDPPVMVRPDGTFVGRLTVSDMKNGSVCGISGNENVCRSLRLMCLR